MYIQGTPYYMLACHRDRTKTNCRPKPRIYEMPNVRNICLSIQNHAWLGPLPWALKGPLPWALDGPLPWALEGPLPWALEGALP